MQSTRIREFFSFACIGALNTGVHVGMLMLLVENHLLGPSYANVVAFLCANVFSYVLNSRLTFRQGSSWPRYLRFLVCGVVGVVLSFLLARGAELAHWHYLAGFGLTAVVMPPVNYWLVRRFAFGQTQGVSA